MIHVKAKNHKPNSDGSDEYVHFNNTGMSGQHTLCGWTDTGLGSWVETKAKVTCPACLAIVDHVMSHKGKK